METNSNNIYKFGGRWICDGPNGRFHAKTKRELLELLEVDGDYDAVATPEDPTVAAAHAHRIGLTR